ncbi:MAG: DUF2490 domain-containing protein [Gammaproteobacteria bacterium]|jgi:hypothetical protein
MTRLFKITLKISILVASHTCFGVQEHTGFWLDGSLYDYLDQERDWSYALEAQLRTLDKDDFYQLVNLEAKLGYHHNINLSFSGGYQWISNQPMSDTASRNIIFEEMYWWAITHEHFVLRTRSRFEQINQTHEHEWGNVTRQRVSFYLPDVISDIITPLIYDEVFIKLDNPDWDADADTIKENWLFLGIDIVTADTWFMTVGYLQHYEFMHHGDQLDNILYLGFNYNPAMVPDYVYYK